MDWLSRTTGFAFGFWRGTWDPSTMYDLSGKTAVVTGGNTGVGYISARELLKKGCKVYIACRSEERAKDAIKRLTVEVPDSASKLVFLPFDLTDLASAKKAAEVLSKEDRLDILLNNAGVMAWPYKIVNGLEVQSWNHFGHFALVEALLPLLKKTAKLPDSHVRIVNVSSLGHTFAPAKMEQYLSSIEGVNSEMGGTWKRYGASKLFNVLFTRGLQKRLDAQGVNIRVLALHPGNINTELTRGPVASYGFLGSLMQKLGTFLTMTPFEGAKTQLWASAAPQVDEMNLKGAYLIPIATVSEPSAAGSNEKLADQLWTLSEKVLRELGPK